MEPQVTSALIAAGAAITGILLGYLVKAIAGEPKATVRNLTAQAKKAEAEADSEYARLAREAAADLRILREEYEADKKAKDDELNALRDRVDRLEQENLDKDRKISVLERTISALEQENATLRRSLPKKGLALRGG